MWIWMIRAIAGILEMLLQNGLKTKLGVWFYNKVDSIYKWAAYKYDVKILMRKKRRWRSFMLKKRLKQ